MEQVVITGGGAMNAGLLGALSHALDCPLSKPPEPLLTGALGAALLGKDIVQKAEHDGEDLIRQARVLKTVTLH